MNKNKTPKDNNSSSQQGRDCGDDENEPRVYYEIIDNNDTMVNSTSEKENMERRVGSEGKTNMNTRSNETALGRLKRKFKRKSTKSCGEDKSTVSSSMNGLSENASRSFRCEQEHIYDVPFTGGDNEDNIEEHVYENGHFLAEDDQHRNITEKDGTESKDEIGEEASPAGNDFKGLPKFQMDNGSSRKQRWQQGKSMSLPVSRVSAKPTGKSPGLRPSREFDKRQVCKNSENESNIVCIDDVIQPLQNNQASNGFNMLLRSSSLPVSSKLDYSHQFLSGLNDLCKRGWYWGPLTSKEAEVMLRGKPDGTFIVRDSNDNRYLLSLSFRSEMRTLHTRIEFCKGKFSFYAAPFISSGCHVSIVDLVEDCIEKSKEKVFCYSKGRGNNGAAFPVRLMKPISRFEHVCSLQHLCRFIIRQHFTLENISDMPLPGMMKRYLNKNQFDATKQG